MTYHPINAAPAAHTSPPPIWNPFKLILSWLRHWLNSIEIEGSRQAGWICRLIPSSCPFERDIRLGSRTFHIPAFCRINPLYEQIIALRLRASEYLANPLADSGTEPCQ